MTNREAYKDEIIKIALSGHHCGVDMETGKPGSCNDVKGNCLFGDYSPYGCYKAKQKWLNEVCVERTVDWIKIAVDTPVKYRDLDGVWHPAYFAGYMDKIPYIFTDGKTSRTATKDSFWFVGKQALHPTDLILDKES